MKRGDVVYSRVPNLARIAQPNHDLFLLASLLASCCIGISISSVAVSRRVVRHGGTVAVVLDRGWTTRTHCSLHSRYALIERVLAEDLLMQC